MNGTTISIMRITGPRSRGRRHRTIYPAPWKSLAYTRRALRCNARSLLDAIEAGLLIEGLDFKLVAAPSGRYRLKVFDPGRIRKRWHGIQQMLGHVYAHKSVRDFVSVTKQCFDFSVPDD